MAPAHTLARLRKHVLDRVARGEVTMVEAAAAARLLPVPALRAAGPVSPLRRGGPVPEAAPGRGASGHRVAGVAGPDRRLRGGASDRGAAVDRRGSCAKPRFGGWTVSHSTVYNVLRSAGLNRRPMRLAAAEALAAAEGGPLTERALRDLRAAQAVQHRHIGSDVVGEQVFLDTMYVGHLKGVGKVWQYTGVDGACSFGFARAAAGEKSAQSMAEFLERDVAAGLRARPGIRLVEVVTDGGPEFTGRAFGRACTRLGVRWHRLPPRSPNLNALRRTLPGQVLHLHYRTAFRYRFYTHAEHIDADLQAWLRYYNFERPHRGYRTRGRDPRRDLLRHSTRPAHRERMEP